MKELIKAAISACDMAYIPFSGFSVGAAIMTKSGKIYKGCNIENSSYSATVCAERVALFKAVSEGEREFKTLALVAKKDGEIVENCPPCGVCRQVLSEFCDNDMPILLIGKNKTLETTVGELLPLGFSSQNMK